MKLGDWLKSINTSKQNLMVPDDDTMTIDPEQTEKQYIPFIVARTLSYFPDCVFHVNRLNQCGSIPNKMHYEYLLHVVPRRSRFSPWSKKDISREVVCVSQFFDVSYEKAVGYAKLLTESQIQYIVGQVTSKEKQTTK